MGKKRVSKAKKRGRTLKQQEPQHLRATAPGSGRAGRKGRGGRSGQMKAMPDDYHVQRGAEPVEWAQEEPEEYKSAPHSFVLHRGKAGKHIKELALDIRKIMEPYTASKLQMRKGNVMKDYISVASYFHVTHMCVLSKTTISPYLKICRVPRGPTLTFRILSYTLARDILSSLKRQVTYDTQFHHHPLLIMNNFTPEEADDDAEASQKHKQLELLQTTFQNMFPSINITTVQLKSIRRALLVNYNDEDDTIDIRHYTITYRPSGVSRGISKLLAGKNKKVPNLGNCKDISEFIERGGNLSESEGEDATVETVGVSQKLSTRGTKGVDEVGIKLVELGPRLKLQLIKVEEGLMDGQVLYHKLSKKTDKEILAKRKERANKAILKATRKKVQRENVQKKLERKEEHRKRTIEGMKAKYGKTRTAEIVQEEDGQADDEM
jgi:ribosome biogenesis protein SSF1/2